MVAAPGCARPSTVRAQKKAVEKVVERVVERVDERVVETVFARAMEMVVHKFLMGLLNHLLRVQQQ